MKQPWGPGLDHIFIQLGPALATPPSLPGLPTRTCVGTLPRWVPMRLYPVTIKNNQVDIMLIDGAPSHAKGAWWLKWPSIVTLVPNREEFPHMCGHENWAMKEVWRGGPHQTQMWFNMGRCLWYPFPKPHLPTYHSNKGVQKQYCVGIRYVYLKNKATLRWTAVS